MTAAGPDSGPWPFLAVLMSASSSADSPPRVRGLGLWAGERVVTLAHVAERADALVLQDGAAEATVERIGGDGDLALMRTNVPAPVGAAPLGGVSAGGTCSVAIVRDDSPRVRIVAGRLEMTSDERMTIELDGMLSEDETASGSPVVGPDGAVIGIVGPTATNRSVDAFGASAIERILARAAAPVIALSPSANAALRDAIAIATTPRQPSEAPDSPVDPIGAPTAMLLGGLRASAVSEARTVAGDLLDLVVSRHPGREQLTPLAIAEGVVPALGGLTPSYSTDIVNDDAIAASPLAATLAAAELVRGRLGVAPEVHLRHLLAAALTQPDERFEEHLFDELRVTSGELRAALRGAVARLTPGEPAAVWDQILAGAADAAALELAGGVSSDLVDPTQGIDLERDRLGVRDYVTMFATVIADRNTPMPLSIGLFGEWGSGKSYFMGLLRGQVKTLADSPDDRYCREIVQIGFNAWHYADSNLWASLGDEIFEQLAGPGETTDARADRLREDLAERLQRRRELETATVRAREETVRLQNELDTAIAAGDIGARGLVEAVLQSDTLGGEFKKASKALGVSDAAEQGQLLAEELRGAPSDARVLARVFSGRRGALLLAVAALGALAVAAGAIFARDAIAAAGVAALGVVVPAVMWFAARARTGLRLLRDVAAKVRAQTDKKVAKELTALRKAEAEERVAQTQLEEVDAQVAALGGELAALDPGRRLYSFVAERAASEDYRRQLGLISTIRKDFEALIGLMDEWRAAEKKGGKPDGRRPIDRIVLYIDDLDRCSSKQVVEVLQAVHLLLALDLFVVVVGVDPRWLLRSLRREYEAMLTTEGEPPEQDRWWEATPQDYLEKIFNLPFALPRMSRDNFGLLIRSLAEREEPPADDAGGEEEVVVVAEAPAAEGAPPEAPALEQQALEAAAVIPVEAESEVAAVQAGAEPPPARGLSEPELQLITALAPLIETPREAKRVMNLYRLIRSTRNLAPAASFLGGEQEPGEYEAVVVLLGLLSGHARLLEAVLIAPPADGVAGGLRHRAAKGSWADFVADIAPAGSANGIVGPLAYDEVADWARLSDGLAGASALVTVPDLAPFQLWAPRIARFSFLLSPLAGEDGE
ncbi:MAG: P-loop NTPase fold protein [Solirubrobacteraceae bacterium]